MCARTSVCLVATGNVPDNGMGSNAFNGGCCRGNRRGIRSIKRRAAPSLCRKSPHRDGYVTYRESNWDGGRRGRRKKKDKMSEKLREYENRASFCGGNQSLFFHLLPASAEPVDISRFKRVGDDPPHLWVVGSSFLGAV